MRPCKCRMVSGNPDVTRFKPCGKPISSLEEQNITLDEFEALRLADLLGMYQEEAAEKMKVSRQTFGNIIETARKKVADALVNGKALNIGGGEVKVMEREFKCEACNNEWAVECGTGRPDKCPKCGNEELSRCGEGKGCGNGGGKHGHRHCHQGKGRNG